MTAPVPWLFAPLSWPDTEREVLVVLRQCRVRWGDSGCGHRLRRSAYSGLQLDFCERSAAVCPRLIISSPDFVINGLSSKIRPFDVVTRCASDYLCDPGPDRWVRRNPAPGRHIPSSPPSKL